MVLEFHKVKRQKLRSIAKNCGIDVGNLEEIDVRELYKNDEWKGIIAYAESELDVIEQLFQEMWGQIKRDGHKFQNPASVNKTTRFFFHQSLVVDLDFAEKL
jgi:hypothetical protein